MTPNANDLCVFAVKRGDIDKRIDINYNLPKYTILEHKLREKFGCDLKPLGEIADVICGPFGSAIKNTDYQESGIPLVRITNISKEGYMNYEDLIYISEELGNSLKRTQVSSGDIIVSQRGSLGQCAIVDDIFEKMNISANIIAVKNIRESSAKFIHDYLLSIVGQTLLERNVSGQVQQKITTQDIADILIPIGCEEEKLSEVVKLGYYNYKNLLTKANELLIDFEQKIEAYFNLENNKSNRLYFAIHLKDLDGVIDAKRYASTTSQISEFIISDICEIVNEKINVSRLNKQVIDWIRIDDLQNQPLDIAEVRTQLSNEVDGTFFEVQKGDILVARLGPTILNQKIVMVRAIERTTIASAEFLVLRCKPQYNPEAVMAVLKTAYYRDLMYSHSRGSTPSRYRLNREDMLKLPFPNIIEHQQQIAIEAHKIREQVKAIHIQAEQERQSAKKQFEKALLGE